MEIKRLIRKLQLRKHPEGGYFKETYRSKEKIHKKALPARFKNSRIFSTAIYFLLPGNEVSLFHRIKSEEIWHFYSGSPLILVTIQKNGKIKQITLGNHLNKGMVFQYTVKAGEWMGGYCANKNSFSLVGCTVSPGFDFNDFEFGVRAKLIRSYPKHKKIITQLTK